MGSYLSHVASNGSVNVLYSQILRLAHDSPRSIERVLLGAGQTAVAFLRDGSRLHATYASEESIGDLEELLRRGGVELVRE